MQRNEISLIECKANLSTCCHEASRQSRHASRRCRRDGARSSGYHRRLAEADAEFELLEPRVSSFILDPSTGCPSLGASSSAPSCRSSSFAKPSLKSQRIAPAPESLGSNASPETMEKLKPSGERDCVSRSAPIVVAGSMPRHNARVVWQNEQPVRNRMERSSWFGIAARKVSPSHGSRKQGIAGNQQLMLRQVQATCFLRVCPGV